MSRLDEHAYAYAIVRRARHGAILRAIRAAPVAIIMTARDGRRTLAIVAGEMSNPSDGAWRASIFWADGPLCHVTRATLGSLARDLACDYSPDSVEVASDADAVAWFATTEFAEGARRVAEVQAWNEGNRP